MNAQIEKNFEYHRLKVGQAEKFEALRVKVKELAYVIDAVCPAGREQAVALTHLESVMFFGNAAIARES